MTLHVGGSSSKLGDTQWSASVQDFSEGKSLSNEVEMPTRLTRDGLGILVRGDARITRVLRNPETGNDGTVVTTAPQAVKIDEGVIPRVYRPRRLGLRGMRSSATWEGVVEVVHRDSFVARLVEIKHGEPVNETAETTVFEFSDLQYRSELDLVEPGAVFYWTIGRATNDAGSVSKSSVVRFKRFSFGGAREDSRAEAEANELFDDLGFDESGA